jgi:endonuclease G
MTRARAVLRKLEVLHEAAARWRRNEVRAATSAVRMAAGGMFAAAGRAVVGAYCDQRAVAIRGRPPGFDIERIIGPTNDLEDQPGDETARRRGRPVARLVALSGDRIVDSLATGFLVGDDLLMTNWHVFEEASWAEQTAAQFLYEKDPTGKIGPGVVFRLDPSAFFYSSQEFDVALVAVESSSLSGKQTPADFEPVVLMPSRENILVGRPVHVIQHPDGRHKHWALRENALLFQPTLEDRHLTYASDTLQGSSGAPAFNTAWEIVALHHTGVPRIVNGRIKTKDGGDWMPEMPDDEIDWIANEGVRINRLFEHLRGVTLRDAAQRNRLAAVLARADGTAPPPKDAQSTIAPTPPNGSAPIQIVPPRASHALRPNARPHLLLDEAPMGIEFHGPNYFFFGDGSGGDEVINQALRKAAAAASSEGDGKNAAAGAGGMFVEKKLRFDPNYDDRPGYDENFLAGFNVPAPRAPTDELLKQDGKPLVLDYHHYSLVMHEERRLVMWTAANVDYNDSKRRKTREEFGNDTWKPDPRIPIDAQIEDTEFYAPAKKFDRGHIVRRDDVAWGDTAQEEEYGNSDSFHWTNCSPQHEQFNRYMFQYKGIWGELEKHIAGQARFVGKKLIVLAGPVLADDDEERDFGSGWLVKVPIAFWKVAVVVEEIAGKTKLRAYGFVLDQKSAVKEYGWEGRFQVDKFRQKQVSLKAITELSRVKFDAKLHAGDPKAHETNESQGRVLRSFDDLQWD